MAQNPNPTEEKINYAGSERAAILLMSMGEAGATEVMKHLGPKEVQKIGEAMTATRAVSKQQVFHVLQEFAEELGVSTALGVGAEEYLRRVLTNAVGEDKASNLIDRILLGRSSKGLEALKWMEPRAIAEIVRLEHPQIIAIVLSYLDADQAAEVLSALPENMRADILMRVASLDGIQPSAIQELDEILDKQFSGSTGNIRASSVGGKRAAANILNFVETSLETSILDKVREHDPDLAQAVEDLMFVFDNLADVDDRSVQTLLREVSSEGLIIALKGSSERVKEKVYKNMSRRAAEMLRDDLEARGPVRVSDVEAAQKEILSIARRMAESGDISLSTSGDDYV